VKDIPMLLFFKTKYVPLLSKHKISAINLN